MPTCTRAGQAATVGSAPARLSRYERCSHQRSERPGGAGLLEVCHGPSFSETQGRGREDRAVWDWDLRSILCASRCPLKFWDFCATGLPSPWQPDRVRSWSDRENHGALTHPSGRNPKPQRGMSWEETLRFEGLGTQLLGDTGRPSRKLGPHGLMAIQERATPGAWSRHLAGRRLPHQELLPWTPPALSPLVPQIWPLQGMTRLPPQPRLRAGRASPTANLATPSWAAPIRS